MADEGDPPEPPRTVAKLKTAVRAGAAWTFTNGGVTHEDTWNTQR